MAEIRVVQGDITLQRVGAIVNAAHNRLTGGGGVDGAIHLAAGPRLLKACMELNWCETGEAKITRGYRLRAKYVIHTVGPKWRGGNQGEPELLESAYRSSMRLADEHRCRSIAFPAISCGAYGYPVAPAAKIAVSTVHTELAKTESIQEVVFVLFDDDIYEEYTRLLGQSAAPSTNAEC